MRRPRAPGVGAASVSLCRVMHRRIASVAARPGRRAAACSARIRSRRECVTPPRNSPAFCKFRGANPRARAHPEFRAASVSLCRDMHRRIATFAARPGCRGAARSARIRSRRERVTLPRNSPAYCKSCGANGEALAHPSPRTAKSPARRTGRGLERETTW